MFHNYFVRGLEVTLESINRKLKYCSNKIFASFSESGYSFTSILIIIFLIVSMFIGIIYFMFFENMMVIGRGNDKRLQLTTLNAVNKYLISFQNDNSIIAGTEDSTLVKSRNITHGLYSVVKTETNKKRDSIIGVFSYGIKSPELFANAIILSKPEVTPTVASKTNIIGNILTSKRKINKGRIFGLPPLNNKFLNGEIIVNEEINSKLFNESLLKNIFDFTTHNETNEELDEAIEIINEFTINKFKNKILQIPNDISIEGFLEKGNEFETLELYVTGITHFANETKSTYNLQIYSDSTISIGDNVHLENAVLVSQTSIDVGSNCRFKNVQFFAKESITISNSEFLFPSVIGMYVETDGKNKYENKIDIGSSVINGTVMLVSSTVGLDENKSKIKIDEESVIHGLVYCENNLELYGEVKGCVYTYNFLYMDGKKEYLNWLVNVKVNRYELDERFLLPMGFVEDPEYTLIKEEWYH